MILQDIRSLSAGLIIALITTGAERCPEPHKKKDIVPAPRAVHLASSRSMRFEYDGQDIAPTQLQNMPAEIICKRPIGQCVLPKPQCKDLYIPKPHCKDLYIVFRDRWNDMDTVYKVKNGSGEIMYFSNRDQQTWVIAADRQPIFDVLTGRLWSIDSYRGDPADELFKALGAGDITLMSKLLNANPTLANYPYDGGMTLPMMGNDIRVTRLAVDAGANLEAKDINGNRPLHYAVYYRNLAMVELLVARKAKVNAKNSWGETPLHFATKLKNEAIADYLIQHGADPSIRDGRRKTPVGLAIGN